MTRHRRNHSRSREVLKVSGTSSEGMLVYANRCKNGKKVRGSPSLPIDLSTNRDPAYAVGGGVLPQKVNKKISDLRLVKIIISFGTPGRARMLQHIHRTCVVALPLCEAPASHMRWRKNGVRNR